MGEDLRLYWPLYWKNETSGLLQSALEALNQSPAAMTIGDVARVRSYFQQWIAARCFDSVAQSSGASEAGREWAVYVGGLREAIRSATTAEDLTHWLEAAREWEIDPL